MSISSLQPVPGPALPPAAARKPRNALFYLAVISTIAFILTEIWLFAAAMLWALSGIFSFAISAEILLAALILPFVCWATWKVVILVYSSESELFDEEQREDGPAI